jgi:AcrR family transcriptional regulator
MLTMCSAGAGIDDRVENDLTTKARIRDGAIDLFGRTGFAATTVRAIAAGVGVSPALLLHHFGSKEGLRQACDDHVLAWYAAAVAAIAEDDSAGTVIGMLDKRPEMMPLAGYVRRALIDGGPSAGRIFDAVVTDTEGYLQRSVAGGRIRRTDDEHGRALLMVVTSLGSHLLAEHLAPPGTPADQLLAAVSDRLMLPGIELYTFGLFTGTEYLDAYLRYAAEPAEPAGPAVSTPSAERTADPT